MIEHVIKRCVECKRYDRPFPTLPINGEHFKIKVDLYLCPEDFVNYTIAYYNRTIFLKTGGLDGTVGEYEQ